MTPRTYLSWNRHQDFLLPPSLKDWLPTDHLVYFVLEVVEQLDLSAIRLVDEGKDARGQKAYEPQMLVALLVYGYCTGVMSSRRLERAAQEDVAFRVLTANQQPHFTTINEFRRVHRERLAGLFVQVLRLCQRAGLVKLGHVAIDGTKVQANASKHKAMSHSRMESEERRLRAEVDRLLDDADATDSSEDKQFGVGRREWELPDELKRRETRIAKIREAKAALEQEAREQRARQLREQAKNHEKTAREHPKARYRKGEAKKAQQAKDKAQELDLHPAPEPRSDGLPKRTLEVTTDGKPKPSSQRNFTDPESSIMPGRHGFIQAYNCQAAVDAKAQVIVAADVSNASVDNAHLAPIVRQVAVLAGAYPQQTTADSGYWNPHAVDDVTSLGVEVYVAVQRTAHSTKTTRCEGPPPAGLTAQEQMRWRLATTEGHAVYARRKAIVEPVFGQIRGRQRLNRLSFRGLRAAAAEWKLIAMCHNILKLSVLAPKAIVPA